MKAIDIILLLHAQQIQVSESDGKLLVDAPKGALTPALTTIIKTNKTILVDFLREQSAFKQANDNVPVIEKAPRNPDTGLPLSFAQQRLWFIDRMENGSAQYNMPSALLVEGALDIDAAQQAITRIINRHESLRTIFAECEAGPVQLIKPGFEFSLKQLDLSELDDAEQSARIDQLIALDSAKVFDLSSDLMIRATCLALDCDGMKNMMLFNMHHIASDGWSMALLAKEFVSQYQAVIADQPDPLPPLDIQYADYAKWQRDSLEGDAMNRQLDYWTNKLEDVAVVHDLPLDHQRPQIKGYAADVVNARLPADLTRRLEQLATSQNMTLFMLLHGALALVLSRLSNSSDIVIGTPVANRMNAQLEPLIGFFINTLVLRTDTAQAKLSDYLAHVKQVNVEAQANQDVPFDQLVEHCQVPRSTAHSPLFQVMFSMNTNESGELNLPDIQFTPLSGQEVIAHFDLDIEAQVVAGEIELQWCYDSALFERNSVEQFSRYLQRILQSLVQGCDNPHCRLTDLTMLSAEQISQLTNQLNPLTSQDQQKPWAGPMHQLFGAQAAKTPNNIAVSSVKGELSYRQLDQAANQLAHHLVAQGVNNGALVGLCVGRTEQMLVAIMAILKAGGAYLPLDPNYPQARLQYMLDDSRLAHLIIESDLSNNFELPATVTVISPDEPQTADLIAQCPRTEVVADAVPQPDDPAYVIYTSGSTGQPKGVVVGHKSIAAHVSAVIDTLNITPADKVWQITSVSFDTFIEQTFAVLVAGGSLYVQPAELPDCDAFFALTNQLGITLTDLPVAYFSQILSGADTSQWQNSSLTRIVVGGEALPGNVVERWFDGGAAQQCQLFNAYGPTEAVITSTLRAIDIDDKTQVRIGRGMGGRKLYVLDKTRQLCAYGAVGELYVGGELLANGYLHREELTRERFISDPFSDNANDRLYMTGDLVRYLPDGNLHYIGRVDEQVKIRGFRIELGEIEHQLAAYGQVASCQVLANTDNAASAQLLAFVVAQNNQGVDDLELARTLRQQLQADLPAYMVPSSVVILQSWPLMPSGKIDKKALIPLAAQNDTLAQGEYLAAQNDTEQALVDIWAQLLQRKSAQISITANFFELGGHSLSAVRLTTLVNKQFATAMTIRDVFSYPVLKDYAATLDKAEHQAVTTIARCQRDSDGMPLSFGQQRLWLIDRMTGGSAQYNMPCALKVAGLFDVAAAQQAITAIIQRHESLRTVFAEQSHGPVQMIRAQFGFTLEQFDLSNLPAQQQSQQVAEHIRKDSQRVFDLSGDLMVRASYLRLADKAQAQQGVLLFNMHHIASDGWSMAVLVKEFVSQYQAALNAEPDPLTPLQIQYVDYAQWQRNWLQGEVLQNQLDYWQGQLELVPVTHELPLDFARPQTKQTAGKAVIGLLDAALTKQLQQLATDKQVTLFMLLHSALSLVLSRNSNSDDIVIGTPVANRMQAQLEPLIGFFVNTLVLRTDTGFDTFSNYLEHVKQVNLDAQANQDVPFEHLVEHCNVPRSLEHTPVFQIMFSMDTMQSDELTLPGVSFSPLQSDELVARFDLEISAEMTEQGIRLLWVYDESLFTQERVERLSVHMQNLLQGIVSKPDSKLGELQLLSPQEHNYLLHQLNDTHESYSSEQLIHQLFEARVNESPDQIAVIFADGQLSYRQLNERANRLAHYLIAQGVGPEVLVGLYLQRSIEMVVAIMAVLKAGGAYVPLDTTLPNARVAYILEDSQIKQLLSQTGLTAALGVPQHVNVSELDSIAHQQMLSDYSSDNPVCDEAQHAQNLAYVIFTSGSTGQPKGVMLEHRALVNRIDWMQKAYGLTTADKVLQKTPYSFDVSVWEFVWTLGYGATLVVAKPEGHKEPEYLSELISAEQITVMHFVPSMLNVYLDTEQANFADTVRYVFCSGEALAVNDVKTLQKQAAHVALHNLYGPTEAAIDVSQFDCSLLGEQRSVPIGKPIQNIELLVLDKDLNCCPQGVPGELYIGGEGLARGYLNQTQLTAEKFIPHPFSDKPDARLYQTGDLVRLLDDGNLVFISRLDGQVKINGLRIELGEIECCLSACDGIASAIVLAREDQPGQKRLVGYVVPEQQHADDGKALAQTLKQTLLSQLPVYMVPSVFIMLDEWPLTANGKINRKALKAPDGLSQQGEYVAPGNDNERALADIWSMLLDIPADKISVTSNFFALGGHSLLAVRMVGEIKQRLQLELTVNSIFALADIRNLAAELGRSDTTMRLQEITALGRDTNALPLSFAQQRLWYLDSVGEGSAHYNMPVALRLSGDLNVAAVSAAFRQIIDRHESIRTHFVSGDDGQPLQVIEPIDSAKARFDIAVTDLSPLAQGERELMLAHALTNDAERTFELKADLMLRVQLVKLAQNEHVLLVTMHHIASDGWSMGILIDEFSTLYRAHLLGNDSGLAPLAIQYADYAHWQRNWLQQEVLDNQLGYWRRQLADLPVVHSLPLDKPRPALQCFAGDTHFSRIDAQTAQQLNHLCQQNGATLFMGLHAVFSVLLARYTNETDIVIGSPIANREQPQTSDLIGFFVNTLVLRSDLSDAPSFATLLERSKALLQDAYAHQQVPFEQIVEQLQPQRSLSHSPLFQVMLVLQNYQQNSLDLPGLTLEPIAAPDNIAKFDLTLHVTESPQGLLLGWEYNTALFELESITAMAEHFATLLAQLTAQPQQCVLEVPMLGADEVHQQKIQWNDTAADFTQDQNIHQLFEAQAANRPDAIALEYAGECMSYGELNSKANRLARYLIENEQVKPESLVGVCLERSMSMVLGILAILKAGGAYVPLDPAYPEARLAFMMTDAELTTVLTDAQCQSRTPVTDEQAVYLDDVDFVTQLKAYSDASISPTELDLTVNHLAYVIYTSGSTGQPKGVMVEHLSLVNNIQDSARRTQVEPTSRYYQNTSIGFDAASWVVWVSLTRGATLVLSSSLDAQTELKALSQTNPISHLMMTPAVLQMLQPQFLSGVSHVMVGGEAYDQSLVDTWTPYVKFFNVYGPTESTICVTIRQLHPGEPICLGQSMNNVTAYVLNSKGQLQRRGVAGELYIGGACLARGYLNREDLTQAAYVANPFYDANDSNSSERLYKTGDLVRWSPDGDLIHMGRIDHQVKIRGFRIEPGEIETALVVHAQVNAAVVVAQVSPQGERHLVAYVVVDNAEQLQAEDEAARALRRQFFGETRQAIEAHLPEYMLPSVFMPMAALPITANGKVDLKRLPEADMSLQQSAYVAPSNEIEQAICQIWQSLLGLEQVGITDNFFELGGHSLLLTRLAMTLGEQFSVSITLLELVNATTAQAQAQLIEAMRQAPAGITVAHIKPLDKGATAPLSYSQQKLWLIDAITEQKQNYHINATYQVGGDLRLDALNQALRELVMRHEALRTVIRFDGAEPCQVVLEQPEFAIDWCEQTLDADTAQQQRDLFSQQAFDLGTDLMLRVQVRRLADQQHILHVVVHHIAFDGWSMQVFIAELTAIYNQLVQGTPANLQPLPISYRAYAAWQRQQLSGDKIKDKEQFWLKTLADMPLLHSLATDKPRLKDHQMDSKLHIATLDGQMSEQLKQLARRSQVSVFNVMFALFQAHLHRWSNSDDVVVGVPVANRSHHQLKPLVGFFVDALAIRSRSALQTGFAEHLRQSSQSFNQAMTNLIPFEQVVELINPQRALDHSPLFQISFNFNSFEAQQGTLVGLELTPLQETTIAGKFDLTLNISAAENGFECAWRYDAALFSPQQITTMAQSFALLCEQVALNSEQSIGCVPYLPDQQTFSLSGETRPLEGLSILDHFEQNVQRYPDKTALKFGNVSYSYAQLNQRCNQLGRYLMAASVGRGDGVAISAELGDNMILALLAIIKIGGYYVPVDHKLPLQRKRFMLDNAQVKFLLMTDTTLDSGLQNAAVKSAVLNPTLWTDICTLNADNHTNPVDSDCTIYVIYTSGSTGQPKGVVNTHRNLLNYSQSICQQHQFESQWQHAVVTPINTDLGNTAIFTAWMTGATLVVFTEDQMNDPSLFCAAFADSAIDLLKIVPGHYSALLGSNISAQYLPSSRLFLGGEAIDPQLVAKVTEARSECRVINHYGPTEATIGCLTALVDPQQSAIPVGRPLFNSQVSVCNSAGQLCPVGVAGELVVSGYGIAKEYINQADLTARHFKMLPQGDRAYATGDRVVCDKHGDIHFLGRTDHQVKLRGFRIELAEIEQVLKNHADIDAVVATVLEHEGTPTLVAFYSAATEVHSEALSQWCDEYLPDYMVPSQMQFVDAMPKHSNGKIDRKRLEANHQVQLATQELAPIVAAQGELELALVELFSQVLGNPRICTTRSFFVMGGDSLKVIRLVALAKERGLSFSSRMLFDHQTIQQLAKVVTLVSEDKQLNAAHWDLTGESFVTACKAPYPITPMQSVMIEQYRKRNNGTDEGVYHVQHCCRLSGPKLTAERLQKAIERVFNATPMLQTSFVESHSGQLFQWIDETLSVDIRQLDYQHLNESALSAALEQLLLADRRRAFAIPNSDALLRFYLVSTGKAQVEVIFSIHHAIIDGWSSVELINQICHCYEQAHQQLPKSGNIFKEFVGLGDAQRQQPKEDDFWPEYCRDISVQLPQCNDGVSGVSEQMNFIGPGPAQLTKACEHYQVPVKVIYAYALSRALNQVFTAQSNTLGVVTNGRSEQLSDPLKGIGLFWHMSPLLVTQQDSVALQLQQIHQHLLAIETHGATCPSGKFYWATMNYMDFHHRQAAQAGSIEVLASGGHDKLHYPLNVAISPAANPAQLDIRIDTDGRFVVPQQVGACVAQFNNLINQMSNASESLNV
ncbi:non-ribosomal peptide synthetase [uncultured Shewanella sp.]|uniref:non-ribosomal peptide synthetase n=1 Tax=uncultured Shewanella sp. TaxID=173975 RepID=UPI0026314234|nr:non-ribosomal peptide synthetase [uncultured Shewanella sp.]